MMHPKIVFLTYHNWEAKQQGGFHKFAEYYCKKGYDVYFFSYPRPLIRILSNRNYYNYKSVMPIIYGREYKIFNSKLTNKAVLTFDLPVSRRFWKYFPNRLLNFFSQLTMPGFSSFARREFRDSTIFVLESTRCIFFYQKLKKLFPNSKFVYRPSDPLSSSKINERRYYTQEKILIKECDLVFIVNQEGYNLYKKIIPFFEVQPNIRLLPNGADKQLFMTSYDKPELLKLSNTVTYVGALGIDWKLILEASEIANDINFIIVTPATPPDFFLESVQKQNNLFYVNGINKAEVPAWVTNTNLIIIPYPKNHYKEHTLGVTAKYYQAMIASKPIVVASGSKELEQYGIIVTFTLEDFINEIRNNINKKKTYSYPIKGWDEICEYFYNEINTLL